MKEGVEEKLDLSSLVSLSMEFMTPEF